MKRPFRVFLYGVAIVVFSCGVALAQEAPADAGPAIMPVYFKLEKAVLRTPVDMQAAEVVNQLIPGSHAVKPFMPTMDPSAYKALKAQAAAQSQNGKAAQTAADALAPPVFRGVSFSGANMNDATDGTFVYWPPDTHGAVGPGNYVQIVNSRYRVYSRTGVLLYNVALKSLFGSTEQLFDPRVIYDSVWKRWIAIATRRPASATDTARRMFLAISTGSAPNGTFWRYTLSLPVVTGGMVDYPQLGMDFDSILMTANIFTFGGSWSTTCALAIPKGILYNGLGISVPFFTIGNTHGTLAPPIVRDRNASTFFLAAPPVGTQLRLFTMTNSSRSQASLSGPVYITVPAWQFPRDANQPGTALKLDTLDARFVNASSQVGTSLFNVHTIKFPASGITFPTPKWYRINTASRTIQQSGLFFAGASSDDFNASIAANDLGDAFVTWSSTMPGNAVVRYSGKRSAEAGIPAGAILPGGTSPTFYSRSPSNGVCRWGDYSAVCVDPLNQNNAWITNEKIVNGAVWGSQIGMIGF